MGFKERTKPGGSDPEGLQPLHRGGPSANSRLRPGGLKGQRAEFGEREETPGRKEPQRWEQSALPHPGSRVPDPLTQACAGGNPGAGMEGTAGALN